MTNANESINSIPDLNNHPSTWIGLTKREYFAAMAMSGLMANERTGKPEEFAKYAVNVADALITELNKTNQ